MRLLQYTSITSGFLSHMLGVIFIRTRHRTTGPQAIEGEALGFPPDRWEKPIYNYLGFARASDATTFTAYTTGSRWDRVFGESSDPLSLLSIIDEGVHKLTLDYGYEWATSPSSTARRSSPQSSDDFFTFTNPTILRRIMIWIRLHAQVLTPLFSLLIFVLTSAGLFLGLIQVAKVRSF